MEVDGEVKNSISNAIENESAMGGKGGRKGILCAGRNPSVTPRVRQPFSALLDQSEGIKYNRLTQQRVRTKMKS